MNISVKHRKDIDGLRTVAVFAVVMFHAFPELLPGGFVGVDVFFVISGFLISSIIFENLERGSFSYLDFYYRRIRRIFPALAVILISVYVLGWYWMLPGEFKQLGKHIAGGAAFASNLISWNEAGYFDGSSHAKPLLHLWSLGVEEQFYIFWPLLCGLVWRYRTNFFAITLLLAVISFGWNIAVDQNSPVEDFYSPITRFWELMIGGILAYWSLHRLELIRKFSSNYSSALGLGLIAIAMVSFSNGNVFPGWRALLPTIGTFLILAAPPLSWINKELLGNSVMSKLGLVSYPFYLWHWPILSFLYSSICHHKDHCGDIRSHPSHYYFQFRGKTNPLWWKEKAKNNGSPGCHRSNRLRGPEHLPKRWTEFQDDEGYA